MKLGTEGRSKWLMEYTTATETTRIDGGDNKPRACLLSAYFYILFRFPMTYINRNKALVVHEVYHVVVIISVCVNRVIRRRKKNRVYKSALCGRA